MKIKYNGEEINAKSNIIATIAILAFKILMIIALYSTVKNIYMNNEFLAIMLALVGLELINKCDIDITME